MLNQQGAVMSRHIILVSRTGKWRKKTLPLPWSLVMLEKSAFQWNVKLNVWHSSRLRGKTRTEKVPLTWTSAFEKLQAHIASPENAFPPMAV